MEKRTSKFLLILWLVLFNVITPPAIGLQHGGVKNSEWLSEDFNKQLEPVITSARKVSGQKEILHSFYTAWLRVTEQSLDSVKRLREEIIQATEKTNYVSLAGSALAITGGIVGIVGALPTGGLSLLLTGGTIFAVGGTVVTVGSGLHKYSVSKEMCKAAVMYMETSKQHTEWLKDRARSYFETFEIFQNFFKELRKNNTALKRFYEIAQSEGFFQGINLEKQTETELRNLLSQIIEIDLNNIKPEDFIKSLYNGIENSAEKLGKLLSELKKIFDDPRVYPIVVDTVKSYYEEVLNKRLPSESRMLIDESNKSALPLIALMALTTGGSLKNLKAKAEGIKFTLNELLQANKAGVIAFNALVVAGHIVSATNTYNNLQEGSISVESEEILKVIDKHMELRNKVIQEMGTMFEWHSQK